MFIKFVIIVIFGFNTLLWDHDAQQYALVFMESISLLQILESEIFYYIKINGHVGCLEHFHHAIYAVNHIILVIYGPIPIPGINVTS